MFVCSFLCLFVYFLVGFCSNYSIIIGPKWLKCLGYDRYPPGDIIMKLYEDQFVCQLPNKIGPKGSNI